MQSQIAHCALDVTARSVHLARKPVLSHSWRSSSPWPQTCPCGRLVKPQKESRNRQKNFVISAAIEVSPRAQTSSKKRKQTQPLVVVEGISKTYDGERILFKNLDFQVNRGDRLALVGPNGAGKSSLFNLLSDADEPDTGTIRRRAGITVGYLSQDPQLNESHTLMEAVLKSGSSASQMVARYEEIAALEDTSPEHRRRLDKSINDMNAINGWQISLEAKRMLTVLGLPDSRRKVAGLSGGQKRRVALAAALLASPDLLILDEPTNHMDLGAIRWMEERLTAASMTLIMVTHDRVFMESVCTSILELDQGTAHQYSFGGPGSYDRFRQLQYERHAAQATVAATAQVQLKKETEWMRRQPKARSTKSKTREEAFYELTAVARSGPKKDQTASFGKGGMLRQGSKVLVLEDACCAAGDRCIIEEFDYGFSPGERIGIVGPNGAGKTSLLDMISGDRALLDGIRELGETTQLGYFRQHAPDVDPTLRIIDYIREVAQGRRGKAGDNSVSDEPEVVLERLGFARPRQQQLVNSLSGGERRRLQLAAVLVEKPNLLILDEPTNDLDLQTVEVVEALLSDYKGCLLVVSHDRAFMENMADRLFVLQGDGLVRTFQGLYSEYLESLEELERLELESFAELNGSSSAPSAVPSQKKPVEPKPDNSTKVKRLGYREKQEYEKLTKQIDEMTKSKETLEQQLQQLQLSGKGQQAQELSQQLAALSVEIEQKGDRWLELAEIDEQFATA